jgi:hypothetical protein
MEEPSYLGKIALVLIWCRMVLNQMITWAYKDSLTLTYPPRERDGGVKTGTHKFVAELSQFDFNKLIQVFDSM